MKISLKNKNKMYLSSKKSINENTYKTYRNEINRLLRLSERKYYQDILLSHKNNLRKTWQMLKDLLNKKEKNLFTNHIL
jgi:hypothetical protein